MGWSDEVHARRTLEIREYVRQQKAAGPYAVPELKGNSSLLSLVTLTGDHSEQVLHEKMTGHLHDVRSRGAHLRPVR
jgi:hypothetical protein